MRNSPPRNTPGRILWHPKNKRPDKHIKTDRQLILTANPDKKHIQNKSTTRTAAPNVQPDQPTHPPIRIHGLKQRPIRLIPGGKQWLANT